MPQLLNHLTPSLIMLSIILLQAMGTVGHWEGGQLVVLMALAAVKPA